MDKLRKSVKCKERSVAKKSSFYNFHGNKNRNTKKIIVCDICPGVEGLPQSTPRSNV